MVANKPEPTPSNLTALFFDLDGTLTDPKIGITSSIQYALDQLGHSVPEANDLTWCIGPPLQESFEVILDNKDLATKAVTLYRERFAAIGLYENQVYEGIQSTLANLARSQINLFVATSKPLVFAEQILKHFDLSTYFKRVFGSDLDGRLADKTELLHFALAETGIAASQAMMIGDRRHDIIGARQNRIYATGVLYGYGSESELTDAGADRLITQPSELSTLIP